jgi:hypothetical protein
MRLPVTKFSLPARNYVDKAFVSNYFDVSEMDLKIVSETTPAVILTTV